MTKSAAQAYGNVAKQISSPRKLEADLLLEAASRLQAVQNDRGDKNAKLDHALRYNRKLWTIFLTSVTSAESQLSAEIRQNVANLGMFVIKQSMELLGNPRPESIGALININRQVAAGLMGRG
ncbi:MAG: flagellar biosynthesis regulator FlaF [Pseudolabrys sp.]|nr:flagellar biosynthesis regulator FlaF [Pseudolabrys sp.]